MPLRPVPPAQAEETTPTIFEFLVKNLLIRHITSTNQKLETRGASNFWRLKTALSFTDNVLAEHKQRVHEAWVAGNFRDEDQMKNPAYEKRMGELEAVSKLTYHANAVNKDLRGKPINLTKREGFAKKNLGALDEERKQAALKEVSILHDALKSLIEHRKAPNDGHTPDLIKKAEGIINALYTFCSELNILDKPYDKTDPLDIFACAALIYLVKRQNAPERLPQQKRDIVYTAYKRAAGTLKVFRGSEEATFEQKAGFDDILLAIEEVKSKNVDACSDNSFVGKVPLSVMMFITVNLPFKVTPGEGSLKEIMNWAEIEVSNLKEAHDHEHHISTSSAMS